MERNRSLIFRIVSIFYGIVILFSALELLMTNLSSWMYLIDGDSREWGIFFISTAFAFTAAFICFILSAVCSVLFFNREEHYQCSWNIELYGFVFMLLFFIPNLFTVMERGTFLIALVMLTTSGAYITVMLICFYSSDKFNWKNIFAKTELTKNCLTAFIIIFTVIEAGTFLYSHNFID